MKEYNDAGQGYEGTSRVLNIMWGSLWEFDKNLGASILGDYWGTERGLTVIF